MNNAEPLEPGLHSRTLESKNFVDAQGRKLLFYTNVKIPLETNNKNRNWCSIVTGMTVRDVYHIPEMTSTDMQGNEMDSDIAIYVDERIGIGPSSALYDYVRNGHPELLQSPDDDDIEALGPEINELLDQGMEALGLDQLVLQIRQEDAARHVGRTAQVPEEINPPNYDTGI